MQVEMLLITIIFINQLNFGTPVSHTANELVYGYKCHYGKCLKIKLDENNFQSSVSLPVCRIFCGESIGTLWPKPTGPINFKPTIAHVDIAAIKFELTTNGSEQEKFWKSNEERFIKLIKGKVSSPKILNKGGRSLKVHISVEDNDKTKRNDEILKLTMESDESYRVQTSLIDNEVSSFIIAKTCFGARHGLETLSQLIVYDDIRHEIQILAEVDISDKPAYAWRGLLLDTSRNFYSITAIKRTLEGMAMVKMNTFHWHITDSQSFPLELKSQPELYKYGAYSQNKIYTHADIADVMEYGRVRGIRILPEFDAPAHVGEGWQYKNMTACLRAQPWKKFCVEPPCGQLDPTVKDLYSVLEDIYREMFELFKPEIFHMGGDEVSISCWNSSERIKNWMLSQKGWGLEEEDFLRLWGYFQNNALNRIDKISEDIKPIILWTSRLTDEPFINNYLSNSRYIIQIWTEGTDVKIQNILKQGFRVILSNYDALYLDCGGAGWVTDGNNWCSPYIGWQKIYENSMEKIAGDYAHLVLGAEAALWSEQIDEFTLDSRLWPRVSALAERLWSNPQNNWRSAEPRITLHRERLIENGIGAETLQPEWCLQNEGECPLDAYTSI